MNEINRHVQAAPHMCARRQIYASTRLQYQPYHQTLLRRVLKKEHQSEDAVSFWNIFDNVSLQLGRSVIYFL